VGVEHWIPSPETLSPPVDDQFAIITPASQQLPDSNQEKHCEAWKISE